MMFDPKIGIIGVGFVGEAVRESYDGNALLYLRDTDPSKGMVDSYEDLKTCEGIFICVPSPMKDNGGCDSSILENVLSNLKDYTGVIISKVTAPPDVYEKLQEEYDNLVYIPEFLTAANATLDYAKQDWIIIGGKVTAYKREAERIIKYSKPDVKTYFCSIGEASLVKYAINSFLATKVVFMNELEAIAEKNGYDWEQLRHMITRDRRIGDSHTQVPGPDSFYGFGGMCFPKDTSALIYYAENLNVNLNVLKEAVKKNTLLRLRKPK